jgi:hypothetical protein
MSAAKKTGPYAHGDRYGDIEGALRTAIRAINKATIAGQEVEGVADNGAPLDDGDFRPLYRELRVAREHVKLVLRTYLKELRSDDESSSSFASRSSRRRPGRPGCLATTRSGDLPSPCQTIAAAGSTSPSVRSREWRFAGH